MDSAFSTRYTNTLQIANDCNYLNLDDLNSSDYILSCINRPQEENPLHYNSCLNMSIQVNNDTMEGFANDHSTKGPGVSYVPLGVCHDGYTKDEKGMCNILEWRGRNRDGDWQRGQHSEIMHDGKENYKICGNDTFLGLSNGYVRCEKNENAEEQIIEGFSIEEAEVYGDFLSGFK